MKIEGILQPNPAPELKGRGNGVTDAEKNLKSFQEVLHGAIQEVNTLDKESNKKSLDVLLGKSNNIHDAMIAMEKAKMALNLTIEVQNKLLEAYKEVNRLQP